MGIFDSIIGSTILGGIFGTANQQSSNDMNYKINQQNLAWAREQFYKNLDWSQQQYFGTQDFDREMNQVQFGQQQQLMDKQFQNQMALNKQQQDYNSAVNQRKRLEGAGLNPYMMMNGGSAGTASGSSASGGSASAPTGSNVGTSPVSNPSMLPMQANNSASAAIIDGLFNMSVRASNAKKANEEARSVSIDNDFKAARLEAEIDKLKSEAKDYQTRASLNDLHRRFGDAVFSDDVNLHKYNAMNAEAQNALLISQTALNNTMSAEVQKRLDKFDENFQMNMALMASRIYANRAAAGASYAAARKSVADAVYQETMNRGWNHSLAFEYAQNILDSQFYNNIVAEKEGILLGKQIRQAGQDYWNPFRYAGNLLGPASNLLKFR